MNRKIISIPPNYFYLAVIIILVSRWFLPQLNLLPAVYNLIGWILLILGIFLTILTWAYFKKYQTPEDFSASKKLIMTGPFRFSRNPMYIGMFLIVLGVTFCLRNVIGLVVIVAFWAVLEFMFVPFEEEKNELTFGQEFLDYKKRVRRWL